MHRQSLALAPILGALLLLAGTAAARADSIVRSGPGASHDPIVVVGSGPPAVGNIVVEGGATIYAGADGASILNGGVVGAIETSPLGGTAGISVDRSTLRGALVNRGTVSAGAGGPAAVLLSGSTVAGGIVNAGTIDGLAFPGGFAPGLVISGGSIAGGLVNSGMIAGSLGFSAGAAVSVAADSFTGGIANSGSIETIPVKGSTVPSVTGLYVGGGAFSGGIVNSGSIDADFVGLAVASASFDGNIVNRASGAITAGFDACCGGNPSRGAAVDLRSGIHGSLINDGVISAADIADAAIRLSAALSGTLVNGGTISGPRGIQLLAGSSIGGGIVNRGRISGRIAAIDLSHEAKPTTIAQKGGFIYGTVLMKQSPALPDTLRAEGGQILGNVVGDGTDHLIAVPGPAGTVLVSGVISGFHDITAEAGRTFFTGHIGSAQFLSVGPVAGTPATLELGAGQISHVGMLSVYGDGTLATEVTPAGAVGQVVARSAYLRGTLEIDLLPGTYGPTTVYEDVVTAPNLNTGPGTTFRRVTTNVPGYTATVAYDNGTADVTLKRTGAITATLSAARMSADPAGAVGARHRMGGFERHAALSHAADGPSDAGRQGGVGARGGHDRAGRGGRRG